MSALIDSGCPGQEMPAGGGIGTTVAVDVIFLLGRRHLGRFARIEAYGDHIEFVTHVELHQTHGAGKAGQSFSTEHGAVVINQVQDERLAAEVVAQLYGLAGVVAEDEVGRNLSVEALFDDQRFPAAEAACWPAAP